MESRRKTGATTWQQAPPPHSARTKEQRVPPPGPVVWLSFRPATSEGPGLGGRRPLRAGPLFSRRKAASCPPAASTINPPADSASAAMAHKETETRSPLHPSRASRIRAYTPPPRREAGLRTRPPRWSRANGRALPRAASLPPRREACHAHTLFPDPTSGSRLRPPLDHTSA